MNAEKEEPQGGLGGHPPLPPPTRGFQHSGIFGKITYSFVSPLLSLGARGRVAEDTAADFFPEADRAEALCPPFEAEFAAQAAKLDARARTAAQKTGRLPTAPHPAAALWATYFSLYRWRLLEHLLWCFAEIAVRVGSPLLLRQFLDFLTADPPAPDSDGWRWAGALAAFSYAYVLVHHQLFWRGMRMGMNARAQAIAAVEAKALRLNGAAVADVTGGRIVNVVSNDVRRFDEAGTFWVFLIGGPLELIIVLVLVGLRLGFPAAVAGVATLLLLIPSQALLARYIGHLRSATAAQTDERVRLTGEAISGVLACKMLAWESPLLVQLRAIRAREASYIRKMNAIRALNMALSYAITPVVSLIAFATARYTGAELTVPNVFYSLALLSLPKLYMCEFFVHAVECVSELRVGMRRLGEFLATPEPPAAWKEEEGGESEKYAIEIEKADFDWAATAAAARPGGNGSETAAAVAAAAAKKAEKKEGSGRLRSVAVVVDGSVEVEAKGGANAAANGISNLSDPGAAAAEPSSASEDVSEGTSTPTGDTPQLQQLPTLQGFALRVRRGELLAIVGPVGAGKSSILSAILGELQPLKDSSKSTKASAVQESSSESSVVRVRGSLAYCQQIPWIMSGSVRDNVLFGAPYDPARFTAAVAAAAFEQDMKMMPAGADTEIGERGISISGGQKARLALARAAYSGAAVQLLDDPLSAVDPRVGRAMFQRCIGPGGLMATEGATRVLVTHQKQYLPQCDRILVVRDGTIVDEGTYAELAAREVPEVVAGAESDLGGAAVDEVADEIDAALDSEENAKKEEEKKEDNDGGSGGDDGVRHVAFTEKEENGAVMPGMARAPTLRAGRFESAGRMLSSVASLGRRGTGDAGLRRAPSAGYLRRFISGKFGDNGAVDTALPDSAASAAAAAAAAGRSGRLVVTEDRAEGSVTWGVYGALLARLGWVPVILCAAGLLAGQAAYLYSEFWLSRWASADEADQKDDKWVWVYAIFAGTVLLISIARAQLFFASALRAATGLHDAAVGRLLRAPLSFYHTNPTGRVLNRFSKDQGSVDEQLPMVCFDSLQALMMVLGAFTLLVIVVPFILPVFLPLGIAFAWVQRRYLRTSRELKRFEAVTRSPLYAAFSATLKGLPTIRAYAAAPRFRSEFLRLLSANVAWWFCWLTTARWIGFRLDLLVAALLTVSPLLIMAVHDDVSPRLAGLALTQSLYLAGMLQWMVRQMAEVENNMTSAERLLAYTKLDQEDPTVEQGGAAPPEGWPDEGSLRYEDVWAVYRPGLPPVLRGVSFELAGGLSCGVVGRTGSGKSSLMLTLFRLIPITKGRVTIDGIDVSGLGLDALRRQIAIIPQDPVLFSGSLRSNLDPWGTFDDGALWAALDTAQLRQAAAAWGGLDARMQEAGDNVSAGQRQLLCLARALLQNAAILALDEATANVDRATDAVIQTAVRRACAGEGAVGGRRRTLLVIAHRIDTVMDCDRLLVLSNGEVAEAGPPRELAAQGGVFARMVAAARAATRNL